jgi:serine protease Do
VMIQHSGLHRMTVASVLVALCALITTGCATETAGFSTAPPPAPPAIAPPTAPARSLPDVIATVEPSVVTVQVPGGLGSGVVYRPDIVVTNQHVVGNAHAVQLHFADGTTADGEVLAADAVTDLAVIRSARGNLPPLALRTDLPRPGETALALGSPLGLENTVTAGIVSAVGRELPGRAAGAPAGLIQTDAPISPGNSGGALVDAAGNLIGINEIYISPEAGAVALGFAIPSATVANVAEQLLARGEVVHPYLGISVTELTPQIRQRLGVAIPAGVVVVGVEAASPAAQAGLQPGDVITAIADQPVANEHDLLSRLSQTQPGQTLSLTVVREGAPQNITVRVGERTS